jgi:iron complex transport system substrate-binding protein
MGSGTAYPSRIVCLTEETTETLYLLGEGARVVGVSGYTVRPPEARQKPRISSFLHAKYDRIEALEPDLILAFSDLQAEITTDLVRRGHAVFTFNQRSVAGILEMIRVLAGIVGVPEKGLALATRLEDDLAAIRLRTSARGARPRVYFEEWDDPQISGIRWVSELIGIAGGEDCFPELSTEPLARNRIIADVAEVPRRAPDLVLGSWCGKKFQPAKVRARPGWSEIPAVRNDDLYEIKSSIILQPGPAALTDGLDELHRIIAAWADRAEGRSRSG